MGIIITVIAVNAGQRIGIDITITRAIVLMVTIHKATVTLALSINITNKTHLPDENWGSNVLNTSLKFRGDEAKLYKFVTYDHPAS